MGSFLYFCATIYKKHERKINIPFPFYDEHPVHSLDDKRLHAPQPDGLSRFFLYILMYNPAYPGIGYVRIFPSDNKTT